MSHFALIDENGIVKNITVGNNSEPDEGYQWLIDNIGGTWIKTSYNTRGGVHYNPETGEPSEDQSKALRKNYAIIGGIYDYTREAFIEPKPYPSWTLNEETCLWESPIDKPENTEYNIIVWNEETLSWKIVNI
jgi:hypothetical protein